MYGKIYESPQTEKTPFYPRSPYGAAKLYAYWITVNYRESYGIYACNGILFNHESPRRGETFVTKKITKGLSLIDLGLQDCIYMGNLNAQRDWGHARDYVEMQWLMLQQKTPEDYVIATGRMVSVRKFIEMCAEELNWAKRNDEPAIIWEGEGLNEVGKRADTNEIVIRVDPNYFRPTEVDQLLGDSTKAHRELGWSPRTSLEELIKEMISYDIQEAKKYTLLKKEGYQLNENNQLNAKTFLKNG